MTITKKKCFNCNKKIEIMEYNCKCDKIFCVKCRMPEAHNCSFDFKKEGKELLRDSLVKVTNEKVIKI